VRRSLTIASLCFAIGIAADASAPTAIAKLDLDSEPALVATTLAFVSEELIAIARYPGSNGTLSGTIITIALRDGKLRLVQGKSVALDRAALVGELHAASHGSILSKLTWTPQLLSSELRKVADIPIKVVIPPVHQADTVAEFRGMRDWKVYQLGPPLSLVRSGTGEVLSVSDDFVVFRGDRDVWIERIEGGAEGSFQVPPRSTCYGKVTILGKNRLLMTGCNHDQVIDFHGKELTQLPRRDGWGFRYGQALDGSRVLFDIYTRRISLLQRAYEFLESLVSLGMGPMIDSNGETIRVVDTTRGGICFELDSPDRLFGRPGEYHADISPSGRYVAVVTPSALSVYRLPSSCAVQ
jgi:hypothetical protein